MSEETVDLQEGMLVEFIHNDEMMRGVVHEVPDGDEKIPIKGENGRTYKRALEDLVVIELDNDDNLDEDTPADKASIVSPKGLVVRNVHVLSVHVNRANGKVVVAGTAEGGPYINQTFTRKSGQQVSVDITIK